MKKARMILSAIAVFAVVGSALAFTGKLGTGSLACRDTAGTCPSSLNYNTSTITEDFKFCGRANTNDCNVAQPNAEVIEVAAE